MRTRRPRARRRGAPPAALRRAGQRPSPAKLATAARDCSRARLSLLLSALCLAAQLKSAAGSYAKMPPVQLLCHYLDDEHRRGFVDSMAEVKVKQEEVIMRQGVPV